MQYPSAFITLFAATAVLAIPLPLNINMGAYSPALVVGDGEIGFTGANSGAQVASLMNTLQGASAGYVSLLFFPINPFCTTSADLMVSVGSTADLLIAEP